MELTFDIIEYMGKMDGGVFVLLNLNVDNTNFYDAIFYYKENIVALTVDEKFEELIGQKIEDFSGYKDIMTAIIKRVLPYKDAINIVNDFDGEIYKINK
jgi:hypothetical protein